MPICHAFSSFRTPAIAVLLLALGACGSDPANLRPYYFPLDRFGEETVYIYEPANQLGLGLEIWSLHTQSTDTGRTLITRIYDQTNTLIQEVRETEVSNGMRAERATFHTRDTADNPVVVHLSIHKPALFPFERPEPGTVYTYEASWPEPGDSSLVTTLTRYRRYTGGRQVVVPGEAEVKGVVFDLREAVENKGEGSLDLELSGEEVYGKGYGLVAWTRVLPSGDTLAFRLKEVLPRSAYEAKYGTLE